MAETKKTAVAKPVAKAAAAKADTKKEEVKVEAEAVVKETAKAETKKAPAKKAAAKKTTDKAAKKPAAKKTTTKTTAAKTSAAKAEKAEVVLQFAGKTYSTEDLVKIAKDVWQYDLKRELKDFKTVSIYVKPEEKLAYYVVNGDVSGSFAI